MPAKPIETELALIRRDIQEINASSTEKAKIAEG